MDSKGIKIPVSSEQSSSGGVHDLEVPKTVITKEMLNPPVVIGDEGKSLRPCLKAEEQQPRLDRTGGGFGKALYHRGAKRSQAKLKKLGFDPITTLVMCYNDLVYEIARQDMLRAGKVVELTGKGTPRAYRSEVHHALYDKIIVIAKELLRYGYGRVPETLLDDTKKKAAPLIVNTTKEGEVYRINDDFMPDEAMDDHYEDYD